MNAPPTAESAEAAVDTPAGGANAPEVVDVVGIPKQQSREEAADSETDEGARS